MEKGKLIIVMGVSGSGKSVKGEALAKQLNAHFIDGDDLHPQSNIDKMAAGIPLTDEDRYGWLKSIAKIGHKDSENGNVCIIACSALKRKYRDMLREDNPNICFVFLSGDYKLIAKRVEARAHHFMHLDMLKSQFETLEVPTPDETDVITVGTAAQVAEIVKEVEAKLLKI
ncbi:gluconokinase [Pedobacter sp. UYP30]|uniref:gluconokinase n=1 Tax=Pedobacter sp. UYP30 TaxID=1756400 RepID=UPI00339981D6